MNDPTSTEQHWVPDRNDLVRQGLIGDHMIRVTAERFSPAPVAVLTYRVTIGLYHKYGRRDRRHREWTSRHRFSLPKLAWNYGVRIVRGATNTARND